MNVSMTKKPQIDKFRDMARELEADESVEKFDAALRRLAGSKPNTKAVDDLADILGMKASGGKKK
jgi:hypothetical protein